MNVACMHCPRLIKRTIIFVHVVRESFLVIPLFLYGKLGVNSTVLEMVIESFVAEDVNIYLGGKLLERDSEFFCCYAATL